MKVAGWIIEHRLRELYPQIEEWIMAIRPKQFFFGDTGRQLRHLIESYLEEEEKGEGDPVVQP